MPSDLRFFMVETKGLEPSTLGLKGALAVYTLVALSRGYAL